MGPQSTDPDAGVLRHSSAGPGEAPEPPWSASAYKRMSCDATIALRQAEARTGAILGARRGPFYARAANFSRSIQRGALWEGEATRRESGQCRDC